MKQCVRAVSLHRAEVEHGTSYTTFRQQCESVTLGGTLKLMTEYEPSAPFTGSRALSPYGFASCRRGRYCRCAYVSL